MTAFHLDVPRARDRDIYQFFLAVSKLIGATDFSVAEIGSEGATRVSVDVNDPYFAESDLFTVYAASVSKDHFSVTFSRQVTQNQPVGQDTTMDRITVNNGGQNNVASEVVRSINKLINDSFYFGPEPFVGLFHNQKTFTALIKSHQEMLGQLQSTATNVTEQLVAARLRLEEEFAERQTKLEQEFQARQTQSEATAEELRRSILNREEELQQRTKELDDRDHIHARRQLREQITSNIADRLKGAIVPLRTSAVGWVVFMLSVVGSMFLAAISYISLGEFNEIMRSGADGSTAVQMKNDVAAVALASSSVVWFLLARGAVTGAGAVAFLVYAISWLKSIYHADVKAQRDLERYSIDLNRASWAVETIMEAKADGGAIPDILVAGVSRNLFDGTTPERGASGATADALGSLLRASAKARIGPSGAEFELNSRGANKIANQLED